MPTPKTNFIDLALQGGEYGRGDCQWGWYYVFKPVMAGKSILDVGTGISVIKQRLAEWGWGSTVFTHEACRDLPADLYGDLSEITSWGFDTVTCFDVIEHVKEYGRLVFDMARLARQYVVITTPGFEITKCTNPCHWHEFYPDELCQLLEASGMKFLACWGAEWVEYPEKPKETTRWTREQIMGGCAIHPVAVAYGHPGVVNPF